MPWNIKKKIHWPKMHFQTAWEGGGLSLGDQWGFDGATAKLLSSFQEARISRCTPVSHILRRLLIHTSELILHVVKAWITVPFGSYAVTDQLALQPKNKTKNTKPTYVTYKILITAELFESITFCVALSARSFGYALFWICQHGVVCLLQEVLQQLPLSAT